MTGTDSACLHTNQSRSYLNHLVFIGKVPAAARSKAWLCDRLLIGTVGLNPAGTWMSLSCECRVLSGRVLCDGLITRPEKSYRVWCV